MSRPPLVLLLLAGLACDRPQAAPEDTAPAPPARRETPAEPTATEGLETVRIIIVGDSLTAGYGLAEEQAFPAHVEEGLRGRGWGVEVVNGGVSGDTTAGGLARLAWLLRQEPDIVVLELGANDGLRGLPIDTTAANLRQMAQRSRQAGARVLLVGMRVPPNYGDDYAGRFAALYPRLAAELDLPLMPFLMDGVGGRPDLNLPDGIHPNAEGHALVGAAVVAHLEPILREIADGRAKDAA
jgi:acyl-CoA thioesterase-1